MKKRSLEFAITVSILLTAFMSQGADQSVKNGHSLKPAASFSNNGHAISVDKTKKIVGKWRDEANGEEYDEVESVEETVAVLPPFYERFGQLKRQANGGARIECTSECCGEVRYWNHR